MAHRKVRTVTGRSLGSPATVHRGIAKSAHLGYKLNRREFTDALQQRECRTALDRLVDSADFSARLVAHATSARPKGTWIDPRVFQARNLDRMKKRFLRVCVVKRKGR